MFKAFVIVSISCLLAWDSAPELAPEMRGDSKDRTIDQGRKDRRWFERGLFKRDVSHPLTGCQVSRAASTAKQRNCFDESGRTLDAATHDGLCAQTKN